jgi:hypothetical protein
MPKKIKPLTLIKLHVVVMGFIGLIAGILYSFGGLLIDTLVTLGWVVTSETPGLSYGTFLAFGALIGMPLIFAIAGLISGIIIALVYSLISKWKTLDKIIDFRV